MALAVATCSGVPRTLLRTGPSCPGTVCLPPVWPRPWRTRWHPSDGRSNLVPDPSSLQRIWPPTPPGSLVSSSVKSPTENVV